jgi:hypothetical protein
MFSEVCCNLRFKGAWVRRLYKRSYLDLKHIGDRQAEFSGFWLDIKPAFLPPLFCECLDLHSRFSLVLDDPGRCFWKL